MGIINFSQPLTGSFLVDVILWLVQTTGSVAVGIILFTVILKLITLPFDFLSRASMRKNSILMEGMRPELEKLQKQYSNNKELYNQKMMALYKKNGYSMWGSCLPTILTLVIFIVAINGFNSYSQYQNKIYFYEMAKAHNSVIYDGFLLDENYITKDNEGNLVVLDNELYSKVSDGIVNVNNHNIIVNYKHNATGITIYTENGFTKCTVVFDNTTNQIIEQKYEVVIEKLFSDKNFSIINDKVFAGFELDSQYIKVDRENKKLVVDDLSLYNLAKANNNSAEVLAGDHKIVVNISGRTMTVFTENGYVRYQTNFVIENNAVTFNNVKNYSMIEGKLFNDALKMKESKELFFGFETDSEYIKVDAQNNLVIDGLKLIDKAVTKIENTTISVAKTELGYTLFTEGGYMQYFREVTSENGNISFNTVSYIARGEVLKQNTTLKNNDGKNFSETDDTAEDFINEIAGRLSAQAFRDNNEKFLWVQNLWVADGAHKHPVLDYSEFTSTVSTQGSGCGCNCDGGVNSEVPITKEGYERLTSQLEEEKNAPNGFYILCILSAGISLLMQLTMNKSQKAQLELQTVDGQGAQNQKMMMWMMPIMMAVFSFIYTSAFSIYIIISSLFSIGTTFAINAIVDKKYKNTNTQTKVVRGRVYQAPKQEEKKKKTR